MLLSRSLNKKTKVPGGMFANFLLILLLIYVLCGLTPPNAVIIKIFRKGKENKYNATRRQNHSRKHRERNEDCLH